MNIFDPKLHIIAVIFLIHHVLSENEPLYRLDKFPPTELTEYRAYRDVTIFYFSIPELVREARWTFNASERLSSASVVKNCPSRSVTVYVKRGSYPVVNPDNSSFPSHFYNDRSPLYHMEFNSTSLLNHLSVPSPESGDWFAIAFLSYTDPNDDQILQQGIAPVCSARLQVALDIKKQDNVLNLSPGVSLDQELILDGSNEEKIYRIFVPRLSWSSEVVVTVVSCEKNTADQSLENCPPLVLSAGLNALPYTNDNTSVMVECSDFHLNPACSIRLIPPESKWLYVSVHQSAYGAISNDTISVTYKISADFTSDTTVEAPHQILTAAERSEISFLSNWAAPNRIHLTRQSHSSFFSFLYVEISDVKNTGLLNISTSVVTLMEFDVRQITDIGGTLTLDFILTDDYSILHNYSDAFNVSVVACIGYGTRTIPLFPNLCLDVRNQTTKAQMVSNSTSKPNYSEVVFIPYPESGLWYVSYKPFCFRNVFDDFGNYTVEETSCGNLSSVNISFGVESFACQSNNCGRYGRCYTYMNGGMLYSTCVCSHGYTGWWCTDDSKVSSFSELLLAALLLTLSNLLFVPSIVFAIRRRYYTEAVVYTCTMFFSTFYHACDAGEDIYSYCMLPLKTLQFCDFYTAILALWVTLIAMARLSQIWRSIAHMIGAVIIALGTEYDRTSLWVFLVPCGIGLLIMLVHWIYRCRSKRSCYPNKSYYKICFIPGVILVIVGLICYAFLQTRSNYKFVHSAWHMIMALAIVFLLPAYRHIEIENIESDKSSDSSLWVRGKSYFYLKWCRRL